MAEEFSVGNLYLLLLFFKFVTRETKESYFVLSESMYFWLAARGGYSLIRA